MKKYLLFSLVCLLFSCSQEMASERWTVERATQWYESKAWMAGCNYIPSNAINQLEMWQKETFDPATIDRELGWASELGFNTMRVYLHSMVWEQDPEGFKKRIDEYLSIADKYGIATILVFFDDCWNQEAKIGKQPEVQLGVHNSGWVHDPIVSLRGDTVSLYPNLQKYVKDVITTFKDDERVLMWDLYNEPGNEGELTKSLPLLKKVFEWAREVNPSQPLTAGVWRLDFHELNKFQLENSDVITYHCYLEKDKHEMWIDMMKTCGRPVICTEWMARTMESTFQNVMPMLKEESVAAISWGLVAGKTNTIFAWSDPRPDGREPKLWFCDIFRPDGTPYCEDEIKAIKELTLEE